MHVEQRLLEVFRYAQTPIHGARRKALHVAVCALLRQRRLTLSALGRSLGTRAKPKHSIKRIDRLLGNRHLWKERFDIYKAMARALLAHQRAHQWLYIVVDWSPCSADCEMQLLRASVALGGRSITLYEEIHPLSVLGRADVHENFLDRLSMLLGSRHQIVVITDAGFCIPWFEDVQKRGWYFVGRSLRRVSVRRPCRDNPEQPAPDDESFFTPELMAQACGRARRFKGYFLRRLQPLKCDLILGKRPLPSRKAKGRKGNVRRCKNSKKHAATARVPWLLATNLCQTSSTKVLRIYEQRMQIEEAFRDLKCSHTGWALNLHRCKNIERAQVLVLIASLAAFIAAAVGQHMLKTGWHRSLQANTIRSRNVLSIFSLCNWAFSNLDQQQLHSLLQDVPFSPNLQPP